MSILFNTPTTSYLVSDLMQETRRSLLGMHRAEKNKLAANIAASDTTITFTYDLEGIARGSYLAIEDEIMYVWDVNPSAKSVTVERSQLGTTAIAHASGINVEVDPRFAPYAIRYALREEIRSWGPQVYQVKSTSIQTTAEVRGYDLGQLINDNFYNILSVRRSTPSVNGQPNSESWPTIHNWRIVRNAPTSDFPSGCGIVLPNAYDINQIYDASGSFDMIISPSLPTISIVYSCPFSVDLTDSNGNVFGDNLDVIAKVGLDETMIDIPPIGAAWRLLSTRETLRTFTEGQGQPADLQFVPPMYIAKAAAALKAQRDSRLADAQIWLLNRYGLENWGL